LNLVKDWKAQVRHIEGLKNNTIDTHFKNMERLLRISHVAPWELKPKHVVDLICHFYDVLPQYYFLHLQIELVFDQMPEKFHWNALNPS
jgi:hypothetical protein